MQNFKGGMVYVYMTNGLRQIIASWKEMVQRGKMRVENYNRTLENLVQRLKEYKADLNRIPRGRMRAMAVYEALDALIEQDRTESEKAGGENRWLQLQCGKGCNHCCYQRVEITTDEAQVLAEEVHSGKVQIDMTKLERQLQLPTEDDAYWRSPREERGCVFLDEQGACKVYDVRPASCRKYFVFTDPANCGNNQPGTKVGVIVVPEAEVLASAASDNDRGSMGLALSRLLWDALESLRSRG